MKEGSVLIYIIPSNRAGFNESGWGGLGIEKLCVEQTCVEQPWNEYWIE